MILREVFSKKFIIFIFGGGIGALLNLTTAWFLTDILGLWYLISYIFGGAVNTTFKFFYHRRITFGVKDALKMRFFKFILVTAGMSLIYLSLIYFLTDILHFHYLISGIVVISTMSVLNFLVDKKWVFKPC